MGYVRKADLELHSAVTDFKDSTGKFDTNGMLRELLIFVAAVSFQRCELGPASQSAHVF
jgi:hypothetical protein